MKTCKKFLSLLLSVMIVLGSSTNLTPVFGDAANPATFAYNRTGTHERGGYTVDDIRAMMQQGDTSGYEISSFLASASENRFEGVPIDMLLQYVSDGGQIYQDFRVHYLDVAVPDARVPVQPEEIANIAALQQGDIQAVEANPFPVTRIRYSGLSHADSIVLIFFGDGFTAAEYGTWPNPAPQTVLWHANEATNTMLDIRPFNMFADLFTVYVIHAAAPGTQPGAGYLRTMNANRTELVSGTTRQYRINQLASAVVTQPNQSMIQVISNSSAWSGFAWVGWHYTQALNIGVNSVINTPSFPGGGHNVHFPPGPHWGTQWHGIVVHEIGHAFGVLCDEHGLNQYDWRRVNITAQPNSNIKWQHWLGHRYVATTPYRHANNRAATVNSGCLMWGFGLPNRNFCGPCSAELTRRMAHISGETFLGRSPYMTSTANPIPVTPVVTMPANATRILDSAFHGNTTLHTLTIPGSVNEIGDFAFIGATGLSKIYNHNPIPQQINQTTFAGLNRANIDVQIPPGTTAAFEAAGWTGFNLMYDTPIHLRPDSVDITDTQYTYEVDVSGYATGVITYNRHNLPLAVEISVSDDAITVTGNRPAVNQPSIIGTYVVTVTRQGYQAELEINLNLTPPNNPQIISAGNQVGNLHYGVAGTADFTVVTQDIIRGTPISLSGDIPFSLQGNPTVHGSGTTVFTIASTGASIPGYYTLTLYIAGHSVDFDVAVIDATGSISGIVRPSPTGAGAANADVMLISMDTGEMVAQTQTNAVGFYEFTDIDNGTYRLAITRSGNNATVSQAIVVESNDQTIDVTNFSSGGQTHAILVHLTGLPNQSPPGTTVALSGNGGTRQFTNPGANVTDNVWRLTGDGPHWNDVQGGAGTVTASTTFFGGNISASQVVNTASYTNRIALVNLHLQPPGRSITFSASQGGTIQATADGQPIISGEQSKQSAVIEFTATPNNGYQVQHWSIVGGTLSGEPTDAVRSVTVGAYALTVTVEFEPIPLPAVIFSYSMGGSLTAAIDGDSIVSGDQVSPGDIVVFTATPDFGYRIAQWEIEGGTLSGGSLYDVRAVEIYSTISVYVTFELIPPPVVVGPQHGELYAGATGTAWFEVLTHGIDPDAAIYLIGNIPAGVSLLHNPVVCVSGITAITIATTHETPWGEHSLTLYIDGAEGDFTLSVTRTTGAISGYVRPGQFATGVANAHVTLINVTTGEKAMHTMTDSHGFYEFPDVSHGTYRIVFTKNEGTAATRHNARISDAIHVYSDDYSVDENNFNLGRHTRMLLVHLPDLPNQNPSGTAVTLYNFGITRNFVPPAAGAADEFWHIAGDGFDDAAGGIGTISAYSPGFVNATADVAESDYVNHLALFTLEMEPSGSIVGRVRSSLFCAGIGGAFVTLLCMDTGDRIADTLTDASGYYYFIDVPDGTFRSIFTMAGRNARLSNPVTVNQDTQTVDEVAFASGSMSRILLTPLVGSPSQNPQGTNVQLVWSAWSRPLSSPPADTTDGFWHLLGNMNTPNDERGGIGTVHATSPGFNQASLPVTAADYINFVAIMPLFLEPVTQVVSFAAVGNGSIMATVNGDPIYDGYNVPQNALVVFTAVPDIGYRVLDWSIDGGTLSGGYTDIVREVVVGYSNISVTVEFEDAPPISVGSQIGLLNYATAGTADFEVTTDAQISPGSAISLTGALPLGVTLVGSPVIGQNNTATITIATTASTPAGVHNLTLSVAGFSYDFTLTVLTGSISGTVTPWIGGMGVANANVVLINIATGQRVAETTTDATGDFSFSNVGVGMYQLVFTLHRRDARISQVVTVNNDDHMVDVTDFTIGDNHRALLVHLAGMTNRNPAGTVVQLSGIGYTRSLNSPVMGAEYGSWFVFGDGFYDTLAGIGLVTASSPGYYDAVFNVTAANYTNHVALITMHMWEMGELIPHAVTIEGGEPGFSANPNPAQPGTLVTIFAGIPTGDATFVNWTSNDVAILNSTESTASFIMINAPVTVTANWQNVPVDDVIFGDVNGDGVVDMVDVFLLRQYLASYPVSICYYAADVNGDGVINLIDVFLLRQYLAGHPIILGPQGVNADMPSLFEHSVSAGIGFTVVSDDDNPGYIDVVVSLDENPGLSLVQLMLHFDAAVIAPVSVTAGLSSDFVFSPPSLTAGSIPLNFESASLEVVFGTGTLATVRFRVSEGVDADHLLIQLEHVLLSNFSMGMGG